jgi:hypothetical protein
VRQLEQYKTTKSSFDYLNPKLRSSSGVGTLFGSRATLETKLVMRASISDI